MRRRGADLIKRNGKTFGCLRKRLAGKAKRLTFSGPVRELQEGHEALGPG